jgi:HAD superfamily hydrolase (TIGR01509 family)
MFKAVIFDMDGVLIDSEMYWNEVWKKFFGSRDLEFSRELKASMVGKSLRENMYFLQQKFDLVDSVYDLVDEILFATDHIYQDVSKAMPGAHELILAVKKKNLLCAVASGSYLYRMDLVAKRFGWDGYFDVLASTDNVDFVGKPAPDLFLYTARELGVDPKHCIVIEDSENGVQAAKAAGMRCLAVLDDRWSVGAFRDADLVVHSLLDGKVKEYIGI